MSHGESLGDGFRRIGQNLRETGDNIKHSIQHNGTHQTAYPAGATNTYNTNTDAYGTNTDTYGTNTDAYGSAYPASTTTSNAYGSSYPQAGYPAAAAGSNYSAGAHQQYPTMTSSGNTHAPSASYPEGLSHQYNTHYALEHPGESLMHGLKRCGQNLKETAQNITHGTQHVSERVAQGTHGYAQSAVNPNAAYTAPNPNVTYTTGTTRYY